MKFYLISVLLLCIMACKDDANEAPGAIDNTTQHPNGVTGGAVISTDTAAMAGDSTALKADSTRR